MWERRCVTTLITAAEETTDLVDHIVLLSENEAYSSFSVLSQIARIIFLYGPLQNNYPD